MAKRNKDISDQDNLTPRPKRVRLNPRLLLLIPAAATVGISAFFIVRRRLGNKQKDR